MTISKFDALTSSPRHGFSVAERRPFHHRRWVIA
jgi:hypothetical protein